MRLGLGAIHHLDEEILLFARQVGATDIILHTPHQLDSDEGEFYDFRKMVLARQMCEERGLRLYAIENVHREWLKDAQLGGPRRDEQIENFIKTVRNMGRAGIPVLGYNWLPNGVWRTSRTRPGRGQAQVTAFDHDLVKDAPPTEDREYTDEDMWANYEYFIKAVAPAAEEAGVRIALHPDDPPVPSLGGVARIFRNHEAFRRMLRIAPNKSVALEF